MMRRAFLVVAVLAALAVPAFAGDFSTPVATGYTPRVPVSAFARPLSWFDSSRLHMTHSIAVGSGFTGGTAALQTTEFAYAFKAPITMKVSVGNTLGTSVQSNGANFFLQGLDMAWQPNSHSTFRIQYQNVRSPLQYGPAWGSPYGNSLSGW